MVHYRLRFGSVPVTTQPCSRADGWSARDLSVEDVHFRRAWITDQEVGYRAATAALSDMAAMGATPVGLLVSIAAPRGGAVDIEAVQAGVCQARRRSRSPP